MAKREDKGNQVIYRGNKETHIWHKNSVGKTTNEGHRIVNNKTGSVRDHNGKTRHKGR